MAEEKAGTIYVVPLGRVEGGILDFLCKRLGKVFARPCQVGAALSHPSYAYHPQRRQYLASAILETLEQLDLLEVDRLLGVVDLDLYAPGLNFVFGQANMPGREAIISLSRLRQEFYGLPSNEALFRERAIKEAVHELGHTYGLGHCPNSKCVMHFSNSLADTDDKEPNFCSRCGQRLSLLRR